MAHIKFKRGEFSGTVGPVRFIDGEADTDLPTMVAHFKRDPERYEVTEGDPAEHDEPDHDEPDDEPDGDEDEPDEDEDGDEDGDKPDPYDVNVAELRKLAGQRGLPQAGSKAELQARLREHDAEHSDDKGDHAGE